VEGTSISLGNLVATDSDNNIASLTINGATAGAVLTDGHNSHTFTGPSDAPKISGWNLSSLSIKPAGDTNFSLVVTATDRAGNISNSATESLTINPLAPTVTWGAAGTAATTIALGTLAATANGLASDHNTLQSLVVSAIPVSDTLTDGSHSFIATSGNTAVNVISWNLSSLKITAVGKSNFSLTATATEVDGNGNTSTATATEAVTVRRSQHGHSSLYSTAFVFDSALTGKARTHAITFDAVEQANEQYGHSSQIEKAVINKPDPASAPIATLDDTPSAQSLTLARPFRASGRRSGPAFPPNQHQVHQNT
jgi:hypothetical protein